MTFQDLGDFCSGRCGWPPEQLGQLLSQLYQPLLGQSQQQEFGCMSEGAEGWGVGGGEGSGQHLPWGTP